MIKIFTLCNAHLDPVWLWQKEEGMAEAVSTFRTAADFCEKYDGFVFNHNESVLYEWVEEYEPELFERIKKLIKQGKWRIMGGWYLQPDCVMPCGESFIRQIETGSRFFKENFGITLETAVNFDPFGHTRGLVQILKKHGYKNYLYMRPWDAVPVEDFIWKGYDGSEIRAHRISFGYASGKRDTADKIERLLEEPENDNILMCWGIGDHGGGPSEEAWEDLLEYKKEHPEIEIISSGCEEFFDAVGRNDLPVFEKSLIHCMVGCYTSMTRVKQTHRKLENTLAIC
ncbi:MAG: alpha-mannosidase, partial [Clostridia bacterium]|nr:alpha-mannosidase [Clostridia bacterium]